LEVTVTMATTFPITRSLVPPQTEGPAGFTRTEQKLTSGLPARIQLTPDLTLVLTVPTGLASTWVELDPNLVVSQSFDQTMALPNGSQHALAGVDRTAVRLILVRGTDVVGTLPLVAGRRARLADDKGTLLELIVLGWEIRAGTVKGPGDFGSSIRLAWRDSSAGVDRFLAPPVSPTILSRLKNRSRGASELGSGLRRLPAGYGPTPPPVPPAEIVVIDVELVDLEYVDEPQPPEEIDYYYTYEVS
jgi:hypothetical protein